MPQEPELVAPQTPVDAMPQQSAPNEHSAPPTRHTAPRPNYLSPLAPNQAGSSRYSPSRDEGAVARDHQRREQLLSKHLSPTETLRHPSSIQGSDRFRWAEGAIARDAQRRERLIAKHLSQTGSLQHPGSTRQVGGSFGIDIGLGDPTAVAAARFGGKYSHSRSNNVHFTLEVDDAKTHGGSGHASGSITIPGIGGAGVKGNIHRERTTFTAFDSKEHRAHWKAERKLFDEQMRARRLNPFRELFGMKQRLVHADAQDALHQAQRPFKVEGGHEPTLAPPVRGTIDTTRKSIQGNAKGFGVEGSYTVTGYKTEVKLAAPVWIPDAALTPKQKALLRSDMQARVFDSFAGRVAPGIHPSAADAAVALFDPKRSNVALKPPEVIAVQKALGREFTYLDAVMKARLGGGDSGQLQLVQDQLAHDWNCTTLKDTLIRMHQTGETLLLTLDAFDGPDEPASSETANVSSVASSREELTTILEDVRRRYGKEFGPDSLTDLHADRPMTQRIEGTRQEWTINAGPPGVNGSCTYSMDSGKQNMPDQHRNGTFTMQSLALNGAVSMAALDSTIPVLADALRTPATEFLAQLRTSHADPTIDDPVLQAGATYTYRTFEPAYARGALTPEGQRMGGQKVEQQSFHRTAGASAGGRLAFPVAAGVNVGVSVGASTSSVVGLDPPEFGTDRIGRMVVHYLSLKGQTHQSSPPWDRMTTEHGNTLLELAGKLADPSSSAHIDARFWLDRSPGNSELLKQFAETFPSGSIPTRMDDPKAAAVLKALEPIFEQIGKETSAVKGRSSLIEPLQLRGISSDAQRTGPKKSERSANDDLER